jgi:transposase
MPKTYSGDMRERLIAEVEGRASRREAAEEFEVSASTAIIWVRCFSGNGPLRGQTAGRKHLTHFKKPARSGAGARGRGPSTAALDTRTGHV